MGRALVHSPGPDPRSGTGEGSPESITDRKNRNPRLKEVVGVGREETNLRFRLLDLTFGDLGSTPTLFTTETPPRRTLS